MQTHKLVMPENLNHFGFLFGGYMLKWVDEIAWVAATLDFPDCTFVTVAMDEVEFKKSVRKGTILRFETSKIQQGTTSVHYQVNVLHATQNSPVFSTTVTMVRVDENGEKTPIEP